MLPTTLTGKRLRLARVRLDTTQPPGAAQSPRARLKTAAALPSLNAASDSAADSANNKGALNKLSNDDLVLLDKRELARLL
jgi:hypothetical protein